MSDSKNLILLAALGAGAYVVLSRRAYIPPAAPRLGTSVAASNPINAIGQLAGLAGRLFGNVQTAPISGGGTAVLTPGAGSRGTLETSTLPYVPFEDGFAANPVNTAPYEAGIDLDGLWY